MEKRLRCGVAAILAGGAILRLWGLGHESFWQDESWSWTLIRGSFGDLFDRLVRTDAHPPLYYLLLKLWSVPFGTSEAALRLFSAILGIAGLPFVFRLGRRLGGDGVGLGAMAFVAACPSHVYFSQETRSYALLFLLCAASLDLLFHALEAPTRRKGAALAVLTAAILYTHYMGGFFLLGEAAAVVLLRKSRPGFAKTCVLAGAGAAALYLPWMPTFFAHARLVGGSFWIPPLTPFRFAESMGELVAHSTAAGIAQTAAALTAIFALAFAAPALTRRREVLALLLVLVVPIAGEALASLHRPIFYARTLLYVLAPLGVLVMLAVAQKRRLGLIAGAATLLLVPALVRIHATDEKEDWRGATAFLRARVKENDTVMVHPGFVSVNLDYYTWERKEPWRDRVREVSESPPGAVPSHGTCWLVIRHGTDGGWMKYLEGRLDRGTSLRVRGAEIYEYRPR